MKQSYADLKNKLDEVVAKLQNPETDLDSALKLHAQAKILLEKLEEYLGEVNEKIAQDKTK